MLFLFGFDSKSNYECCLRYLYGDEKVTVDIDMIYLLRNWSYSIMIWRSMTKINPKIYIHHIFAEQILHHSSNREPNNLNTIHDGLTLDCSNSIANALFLKSYDKPSIYYSRRNALFAICILQAINWKSRAQCNIILHCAQYNIILHCTVV